MDKFPKEKIKLICIIAYDGSSLLEEYLEMDDPYIDILLSQNYMECTSALLNEIKDLVTPAAFEKRIDKVKRINPNFRMPLGDFEYMVPDDR